MKKFVLLISLCLIAGSTFAQKKALKDAKNEIKKEKANLEDARTAITSALADPETKDLAETWFVAGMVEDKQFEIEKIKESEGGKPNEDLMYPALVKELPFFIVADSLDKLPNEKGKVNPKYGKEIQKRVQENRPYYVNAGMYFNKKNDYQKAYENFRLFGDIPKLKIFDGDPFQEEAIINPEDTLKIKVRYNAALSADMAKNYDAAIELYQELKNMGQNEEQIYKRLIVQYSNLQDTTSIIQTLKEGAEKFDDPYYLLTLIEINWERGQIDEAKTYLLKAIETTPNNAQLYNALASIYEKEKETDKAISSVKKALEINPEYYLAALRLGLIYYNLGIEKRTEMDDVRDRKLFEEGTKQVNEYFKQGAPYLEKAYELNNEEMDAVQALRNIYYSLGQNDDYERMDKIFSGKTN